MNKIQRQELALQSADAYGFKEIFNNESKLICKLKSGSYGYSDLLAIRDTIEYALETNNGEIRNYDIEKLQHIVTEMLNKWMYTIFDQDYY